MNKNHILKIGITASFIHPDINRNLFKTKTILCYEESLAQVVLKFGALPILLPTKIENFNNKIILSQIDGIILQGGADIAPCSYNEEPIKKEWEGDRIRDLYELEIIKNAMELNIPIFGICRGMQLLNVFMGGTMYQDIATQISSKLVHRNAELYDKHTHEIYIKEKTYLSDIYKNAKERKIVSIHHQAVKDIGKNLVVEAFTEEDGVVEALRYFDPKIDEEKNPFIAGVQWHPEFHNNEKTLMNADLLFQDFFNAVKVNKINI